MTKTELLKRLESYPDNAEVMILDGFNGGGVPRTINFGPHLKEVTVQDAEEAADCEDIIGRSVIVMGFGCY